MQKIKLPNTNARTLLTPRFPRWDQSFVSGSESPLFRVSHGLSKEVPDILITEVRFLKRAMGPPGHVHGGASAALIDETMGVLAWALGNASVTETLMLQYRKPIPLEEPAIIYTWIHHQKAKKITIRSELHLATKKTAVFAEGVFHRLSPEQLKQFQSKY